MNLNFNRFAELAKVESQSDGTIKVWGYASSGAVDADGETITPEAMKAALPDYMKFGAVRDMHQPNAVGTAIEANVEDDGRTFFGAHIVDPVAVKKVLAKVFKGFSIGGRIMGRDELDKSIISSIKLIEISLVDRPANPEAVFTMYKAEGVEEGAVADPVIEAPVDVAPPLPETVVTKADPAPLDRESIELLAVMVNKGEITPAALLEAARAAIAPPPAPTPPVVFGKGMGDLSRFAALLKALGWFVTAQNQEQSWEGDNSQVPQSLQDWLAAGLAIFQTMAAEESAELLTYTAPPEAKADMGDGDDATPATPTDSPIAPPAVAGDQVAISDAVMDSVVSPDNPVVVMADTAGDLLKAALAVVMPVTEKATTELAKAMTEIETLKAQVAMLLAQPVAAKGVLNTNGIAISKSEDAGGGTPTPGMDPVYNADGTVDEAATLLKVVHRGGGRPIRF